MKKSLIALAAGAATSAFAQSTVTLSGVMDVGVVYSSNADAGSAKLGLNRGNNNTISFAGVEDLGGGMAATFRAAMRFEPTTGTAEAGGARPLFQAESRVGLRGGFGHIRLGRGLTALQAPNGSALDPWVVTTVASSVYAPGYWTDYVAGGEGRTDGIFYDTPNFSGLSGSVTLSPRKATLTPAPVAPALTSGTYGSKSFYSLALSYGNGPIVGLVGYEQNRFGDSLLNIGGNYDLGAAKLYVGYGVVKGGAAIDRPATTPGASPLPAGAKNTALSLGATIPFGAAKVLVGYSSFKQPTAAQVAAGTATKTDTKLGLGVNYALSKRTAIYSNVASTSRNNNPANPNPRTNDSRVTAFDLGISHSF